MDWDNAMNILNNWKMLDLVTRDGQELVCIEGRVYGSNPRFPSSSHIRTSPITAYALDGNSMVVTTRRGSEYVLGKPDPSETFAQQRLLRRLSRLMPTTADAFDALESQLTGFDDNAQQNRRLATAAKES
ncbi:MAG: hypothetical protein AW07_03776 [Candidatus Accumulibacter sp. SK-11]|nr:MAG: hypothetical protein AW07_03776 [Candidatus Accumulibacter sp. SK-11]HCV12956.1 hypothetical protein [Accumulibacter sp.]